MRSYDGESSSTEDDDRREGLPETHLQQGSWQRTASHPTWAWEHRNAVSNNNAQKKQLLTFYFSYIHILHIYV